MTALPSLFSASRACKAFGVGARQLKYRTSNCRLSRASCDCSYWQGRNIKTGSCSISRRRTVTALMPPA